MSKLLKGVARYILESFTESKGDAPQNINVNIADLKLEVPKLDAIRTNKPEAFPSAAVMLIFSQTLSTGIADIAMLRQLLLNSTFNIDDLRSIARELDRVQDEISKGVYPTKVDGFPEGTEDIFAKMVISAIQMKREAVSSLLAQVQKSGPGLSTSGR